MSEFYPLKLEKFDVHEKEHEPLLSKTAWTMITLWAILVLISNV